MIAIFLSGSVGIFLSLTVFRRLFSRNRHHYSVKKAIIQSLKTYILVILPLVLLAALIEGYVTPILIHKVV
ncbi:stage II sporulation protein M [Brevibacillus laterosporus]